MLDAPQGSAMSRYPPWPLFLKMLTVKYQYWFSRVPFIALQPAMLIFPFSSLAPHQIDSIYNRCMETTLINEGFVYPVAPIVVAPVAIVFVIGMLG